MSQTTLFVPFLGQSHGEHLSSPPYVFDSASYQNSGATVLEDKLTELTGYNIVTSTSRDSNFAVGNSQANGDGLPEDRSDNLTWWYPQENKPGGALLTAEIGLTQWLRDNEAQSTDEIAIVWSQGESDARNIDLNNPATIDAYKESTIAIFDYLTDSLEYPNLTFYILPTGRFHPIAAINAGLSETTIATIETGLVKVRQVQSEIALERDDVQLAPDYSDLLMVYEEGQFYGDNYYVDYKDWFTDYWHLGSDGLKVDASRLAQYIALDRGQHNVISFVDSLLHPASSVSISRNGLLDLNISDRNNDNFYRGTSNPDLIVGSSNGDRIEGQQGNDIIVPGTGFDTLTGGEGDDIFFYRDLDSQVDLILDFDSERDRIDLFEPLRLHGYNGTDPIADGYITVELVGRKHLIVRFDPNGSGAEMPQNIALLLNADREEFLGNISDRFTFFVPEF